MRHAYLTRLHELQTHAQELEKRDTNAKRTEASVFPQTTVEFNSSPREAQVRVAKFLIAQKLVQEQMMDEFGWAWRATQPLLEECKRNVSAITL